MTFKMNEAYREATKNTARHRILYGGAGSGKSHFVAQETVLRMLQHPEASYLGIRKTAKSIRHSMFQLMADVILDADLGHLFRVNKSEMAIFCKTGARFITSGLDDVEKLKSISGINRIWVEEASEISEEDFNQLNLRLRGNCPLGYQMTLTFNPISELHWLKKRFFDQGTDAYVLKTTYKDNKFLDEAYIRTLKRLEKEDYQYFRIYALGEWGSLGNLVYTNWERQDLSGLRDSFDNYYNGLDWGFADDPLAFIRCHYEKKRKIIYVTDELFLYGMHNDETAPLVKQLAGDDIIICDSAEPKSVADFKRLGLRALPAKKGPGSVEHGIKWLQGHKIIIDVSCQNFIKELTSYKWREDKDGNTIPKPVDINNHGMDAIRYGLEPVMQERKLHSISKNALGV